MEDDLSVEEFMERNNLRFPDEADQAEGKSGPVDEEEIDLDTFLSDDIAPIRGTGQGFAKDVTDEVKAANDQDPAQNQTYQSLYGEKPSVGVATGVKAAVGDGMDFLFGENDPSASQSRRDAVREAQGDFMSDAEATYESLPGVVQDNGRKFYKKAKQEPDGTWSEELILIPTPEESSGLYRVVEQAGRTMFQGVGSLLTEGKLAQESELDRKTPDRDLTGGEQLLSDVLGFGIPAAGAAKAARAGAQAIRGGQSLGSVSTIAVNSLSASLSDAAMAQGEDGLFIKPEAVQSAFKGNLDEGTAKDLAMYVDGLVINGGLDTLLALGTPLANFGKRIAGGITQAASKKYAARLAREAAVLNTATALDPGLRELMEQGNHREVRRYLGAFSRILDSNKIRSIEIGDFSKEVPVDSTDAIMQGAEAYFRETRQSLQNTMSEAEFDAMIKREAGNMSATMIQLLKSNLGDTAVRETQARTAAEIGGAFKEAAELYSPPGRTTDEAARDAASDMVVLRNQNINRGQEEVAAAQRGVDEVAARQATVVQDNPIVSSLIQDISPGLEPGSPQYQAAMRSLIGDGIYPEFKRTMDRVDAAYDAIPEGTPIDGEALYDQLQGIFRAATDDVPGNPAQKTRSILSSIDNRFQPRELGIDDAGDPVFETFEEVIDRIENGVPSERIDFKDLYQIKGRLARVINDNANNPAIRNRLTEFRNHITDTDSGQMAYIISQGGDTAEIAQTADSMYKEAVSRFRNSDAMREFTDTMQDRRVFDGQEYPGPFDRNEPDMLNAGERTLSNAASDPAGVLINQLRYMAEGASGLDDLSAPLVDYYAAQGARQLARAIADGNKQDAALIRRSFQQFEDQLGTLGATDLVERTNRAIREVDQRAVELGDERLGAEKFLQRAEANLKEAQNSILENMMNRYLPNMPTDDAREAFERLLFRGDGGSAITEIRRQIADMPEPQRVSTEQTLKAVTLDFIGEKVFGTSPIGMTGGTSTAKNPLGSRITQMTAAEGRSLGNALEVIFQDNPGLKDGIFRTLGALEDVTTPPRTRVSISGSDTEINRDIRNATSTMILLSLGYMNPAAATARRVSAEAIEKAENLKAGEARKALATIIADPEGFSRGIDVLASRYRNPEGLALDKDLDTLNRWYNSLQETLKRGGISSYRINPEDDQMDDMLEDSAPNIDQQMEELQ